MMDAVKFITEHPRETRRCRRTRISTPTVNERTEAMTPPGFAWAFYEANK